MRRRGGWAETAWEGSGMVAHVERRREWLGEWVGGGSLVVVVSGVHLGKFNGSRRTSPCFGVLQSALLGLLFG